MAQHDDPPDPSKPASPDVPAAEAPPRAPFDPPVRDAAVLALLKGLKAPTTPEPMPVGTTDGELEASFSAGPRGLPMGEATAPPEASVVVREDPPPKKLPEGNREALTTTYRIRPSKISPNLIVVGGVLLVGVVVAAWLGRRTPVANSGADSAASSFAGDTTNPTATARKAAPVPVPPPYPSDIPPVPTDDPAAAPTPPPANTDPGRVAPPQKAQPAPSPAVKPTKGSPSRRKEDEPERVL